VVERPVWLPAPGERVAAVPWLSVPEGRPRPLFRAEPREPSLVPQPISLPPAPSAPPPPPPVPSGPPPPDPEVLRQRADLAAAVQSLVRAEAARAAQLEERLVGLAIELAEAILEEEIHARPELHRALARAALAPLDPTGAVTIRAGRASHDAMLHALGGSAFEVDGRSARLVLDPALEGAGCVVEVGEARADGRIRQRLDAVRRAHAEGRLGAEE